MKPYFNMGDMSQIMSGAFLMVVLVALGTFPLRSDSDKE